MLHHRLLHHSHALLGIIYTVLFTSCTESSELENAQNSSNQNEYYIECPSPEVDTMTSAQYCGAVRFCANTECTEYLCTKPTPCSAGQVCEAGKCTVKTTTPEIHSCPPNAPVLCGNTCIDPLTHSSFCGADSSCMGYSSCQSDEFCEHGKCQKRNHTNPCAAVGFSDFVSCSGVCIDPNTSSQYCGADENCQNYKTCPSNQTCHNGSCEDTTIGNTCSQKGFVKCGQSCIDPMTNPNYCGADIDCNIYTSCNDNQLCKQGKCVEAIELPTDCQPDEHIYNNSCEKNSITNCGTHNRICANTIPGWNSGTCDAGVCKATSCVLEYHLTNGTCALDSSTCCGNACMKCKASEFCSNGQCTQSCDTGTVNCKNNCINPLSSLPYCGANADCSVYIDCTTPGNQCINGQCLQCLTFTDPAIQQYAHVWWDKNRDNCIDPNEAALVTEIPYQAFKQNNAIENLDDLNQFPNLKTIGEEAFMECPNLKTAVLTNIETVKKNAFYSCKNLKNIDLSASTVDFTAFWENNIDVLRLNKIKSLPSMTHSDDKKSYSNAFVTLTCNNRECFPPIVNGAVFDPGSYSIKHHFYIKSFELNSLSITEIYQYQFAFSAIESFTSNTISVIDSLAFYKSSTNKVKIPGLLHVGYAAFSNCTGLTEISLPKTIIIDDFAFHSCTNLTKISMPEATTIGDKAFYGCSSLTEISMPEATTIDSIAFYGCSSLTKISLPKATTIGSSAFQGCSSLTEISLPKATTIGSSAFQGCSSLTEISMPEATTIGNYAFYDCSSLKEISLPEAITIGLGAFSGCSSLTEISMPEATTISDRAFQDCLSLTEISMPKAINIGHGYELNGYEPHGAFMNCKNLTKINLPEAATIGSKTFENCTSLTEITLPKATKFMNNAFSDSYLTKINLPEATTIGSGAFYGCSSLTEISMPEATTIDSSAFYGCSSLKEISLPKATTIGDSAFSGCSSLTEISMPEATTIGNYAFYGCSSLTEISLPKATTIGTDTFAKCTSLTELNLPETTQIGALIFQDSTNLNKITLQTPSIISLSKEFGGNYVSFSNSSSSNATLILNKNKQYGGTSSPLVDKTGYIWGGATWKEIQFVE